MEVDMVADMEVEVYTKWDLDVDADLFLGLDDGIHERRL